MPVLHSIIHKIDKKPDGTPAILHYGNAELIESQARDDLMSQLNESYNAKTGKAWGLFHADSGAFPLSGWLDKYLAGADDFVSFSGNAVEHLTRLMEESNLSVGGNALFCHYQQGLTEYLTIALVQETEAVVMTDGLTLMSIRRLDLDHIHLAARINLSEWKSNPASRQYISFIKGKSGRKANDYFRDFIGCQQGVDGPGVTRTLLKAFSDFVESEDLGEESAREKTQTLVSYSMAQAKLGEPITLDELSELIDEDQPKQFADFIRDKDYGLSETIPADKKTLSKFRRFTGRAEGLSISFEQHLLGSKIEFDEVGGTLTLRGLPTQLTDQLKRAVG
ncbi:MULTISPECIES: nucleoid-associated protein YejK [Pseudomonas chlororaphis group]|uniref:nucleoid-associated protein YejK n=1 Tax=Pseudomonas chlororaphis group TaxID=136842 RepID=UPI002096DC55|nr:MULTISPECIES: nucleoid-associated protein YejK [Pseudomonas chlororaphis group]MCO7576206.1 nucleoid-associated protein YejK [Pseudomonas protegens]MCO7580956.1 nucleoid-associated protein YejK [Pseudomonas chlororaphis]MCO7598019.1 nucleoid-associated protein YejK [Pseudomonas chlororaphis]